MLRSLARLAVVSLPCLAAACSSGGSGGGECTGNGNEALRTCAAGPVVHGVDVSYYQGTVNWAQVKASGRAFAFARVSDGLSVIDAQFATNWPAMKQAGLVRGAYQFFRPAKDPIAQADLMLQKIQAAGGLQSGDLPPVLDVETVDGVATATIRTRIQQWLDHVEQALGRKPIIYTAAFMSQTVGTGFSKYPLWVANYGVSCPTMPDGWSTWRFWQSSSTGSVNGISGNVDVNDFNGTLAELLQFAGAQASDAGVAHSDAGSGDAGASLPNSDNRPPEGSQGSSMGQGEPPPPAPAPDPCAPKP